MTRDEIWKMEAGRELDALIHEQVFGKCAHDWIKVTNKPLDKKGNSIYKCSKCGDRRPAREAMGWRNYSTDIAAAWQVVEKMSKLYHVEIENFDNGYGVTLDDYSQTWEAHADTAPLAICRAALLAVMD